jgi:hypothetical protein
MKSTGQVYSQIMGRALCVAGGLRCILGLSLREMVANKRLERPRSRVKTEPTSLHGRPILVPGYANLLTCNQSSVCTFVIRLAGLETNVNIPVSWFCVRHYMLRLPTLCVTNSPFLIRFVFLHITRGD